MKCDPLSTANPLWLPPAQRQTITNPITKHSLSIWDRLRAHFGLQSKYNPLYSFLNNPSFYPAWTSLSSFNAWSNAELIRSHHFYKSTTITPFATCFTSERNLQILTNKTISNPKRSPRFIYPKLYDLWTSLQIWPSLAWTHLRFVHPTINTHHLFPSILYNQMGNWSKAPTRHTKLGSHLAGY